MKNELFDWYPCLKKCKNEIKAAIEYLIRGFRNGNKLLLCGNGGSAADCEHISGELMKGFIKKRPLSSDQKDEMRVRFPEIDETWLNKLQNALPVISLPSFMALNSAFCNDVDAKLIYAQQVMGLGNGGDMLMCISTSGNSENVVAAAIVGKARGLSVIALTGSAGGRLADIADVCIRAPESETFKVQELHLPIYHHLCMEIESAFFNEE